ncbi:MAG TPA: DUF6152 family protein [Terriglobia bacterium]|nr:DUF6152 family protein [Terriglobia bacterium]
MKSRHIAWTVAFILVIVSGVYAHHSFAALFDVSRTINLTGQVTKLEFRSPHAYIYIKATDSAGASAEWQVETTTPGMLIRKGITPDTVRPGQKVSVSGNPTRDGRKIIRLLVITMPDGKKIDVQ